MDLWVKKSEANYQKLAKAFFDFKMPVFDMTEDAFLNNPDFDVFTFGRPPVAIDIMTSVKGLDFDECFLNAQHKAAGELQIRLLSLSDLLKAKKASGRPKDIDDISYLS